MVTPKSGTLQWDDQKKSSKGHSTQSGVKSTHSSHRRSSKVENTERTIPLGSIARNPPVHEDGKDVTPKMLFSGQRHTDADKIKLEDQNAATDYKSFASMMQSGVLASGTGIGAGSSLFGKSILGSGLRNSIRSMSIASQTVLDEVDKEVSESESLGSQRSLRSQLSEDSFGLGKDAVPCLTDEQLEANTSVVITETQTIPIFKIYGTEVCEGAENIEKIQAENEDYEKLVSERVGSDKYSDRAMLTFHNNTKDKETLTNPLGITHTGSQASTSILFDAYNTEISLSESEKLKISETSGKDLDRKKSLSETVAEESEGDSLSSQTHTLIKREPMVKEDIHKRNTEILESVEMNRALKLLERVLTQNIYQRKIATYRGLVELDHFGREIKKPPAQDADLIRLWAFATAKSKGFTVTCISWNHANPDIIAVSYGYNLKQRTGGSEVKSGIVCCWNIKNLEHPERTFVLPSSNGATCCDWSHSNPNLLAVGLFNGNIVIYNVARQEDQIILEAADSPLKHLGPVWSIKWAERERGTDERDEVLLSTSHDGRVVQWTIRKGFEALVLMKVKRTDTRTKKAEKNLSKESRKTESARISQFAPTTAFDFHPADGNTYLVGTEEGAIHRCSCSYNEQTLDTYLGHTGRVYAVKWHPKCNAVFLSCSEDWTIRIWHQKYLHSAIVLQSGQKPIKSISWSPYASTIFVAITDDTVDVWDTTQSILDPTLSKPFGSGADLSQFGFSPCSNCVLVGDSEGTISVYQVRGLDKNNDENDMLSLVQASLNTH